MVVLMLFQGLRDVALQGILTTQQLIHATFNGLPSGGMGCILDPPIGISLNLRVKHVKHKSGK